MTTTTTAPPTSPAHRLALLLDGSVTGPSTVTLRDGSVIRCYPTGRVTARVHGDPVPIELGFMRIGPEALASNYRAAAVRW